MHATLPDITATAIRDLASRDLDHALATLRRHLRSHPEDAPLLGELARITTADAAATATFRSFIRDVIADAIADEQRNPRRSSSSDKAGERA